MLTEEEKNKLLKLSFEEEYNKLFARDNLTDEVVKQLLELSFVEELEKLEKTIGKCVEGTTTIARTAATASDQLPSNVAESSAKRSSGPLATSTPKRPKTSIVADSNSNQLPPSPNVTKTSTKRSSSPLATSTPKRPNISTQMLRVCKHQHQEKKKL